MTIQSTKTSRELRFGRLGGDVSVDLSFGLSTEGILVAPEDFAHEVAALGIPGLTYDPPVKIPTKPGVYLDKHGSVWRIDNQPGAGLHVIGSGTDPDPRDYAPFTRLVPEGD